MKDLKRIFIVILCLFTVLGGYAQNRTEPELKLLPWPEKIVKKEGVYKIDKAFNLGISGKFNDRLYKGANRFLRRLDQRTGMFFEQGLIQRETPFKDNASLTIIIERPGSTSIDEDESYNLNVYKDSITLQAVTDIGALRGLETLLQLLEYDDKSFFFPAVSIQDKPRFPWRGLMIDVARHYQPVDVLKRNLDAMAAVKLNVFHWHLSDDQGFRVEIKTHPRLTELGSDGLFYTQEQIREIVAYASDRGITVVPEIDVPGHATAILTAYPELASKKATYTIERNAGIFHPTLNPINPDTYVLMEDIFGEMASLFPGEYFHIGGDENEGKHWDENSAIQEFMKDNHLKSNHDLQTYFNIRLEKILNKHGKKLMGWEEIMTPGMPQSAIIHSWRGVNEGLPAKQSLVNAVKNGYKTVLSNGYYIDLMYPVASHYLVDPMPDIDLTDKQKKAVLGGEATMWGELITPLTIDSRIWPRTAAIAERFWSPREVTDLESLYMRLETLSFRLEELGITHKSYRNIILRNITNNQKLDALIDLTGVCEPLKGYTRNKGGIEYQSYAPFTLFADACTADAPDAGAFQKATGGFIENGDERSKKEILKFLKKWSQNKKKFDQLRLNPILKELKPLSENVSLVSEILMQILEGEKVGKDAYVKLKSGLKQLRKPYADTELVIVKDMESLLQFAESL